jgi:carbon storage regulator CsrA
MLILSRKSLESVMVGGPGEPGGGECLLKVTVLEIRGQSVRLGFEAEGNIPIHRWEVWERIRANPPPATLTGGPPAASSG